MNKLLMTWQLQSFAVSLAVLSQILLPGLAQSQRYPTEAVSSKCRSSSNAGLLSWKEYSETAVGKFVGRDYDLPKPFRNTLIWYDYGANTVRLYVFAENLCPPITKARGGNELQRNIEVAEQYVKSGQALKFDYGFSSPYYNKYINDSRIRLESNSSACLRVTCLEGSSLERERIVIILRSERVTK